VFYILSFSIVADLLHSDCFNQASSCHADTTNDVLFHHFIWKRVGNNALAYLVNHNECTGATYGHNVGHVYRILSRKVLLRSEFVKPFFLAILFNYVHFPASKVVDTTRFRHINVYRFWLCWFYSSYNLDLRICKRNVEAVGCYTHKHTHTHTHTHIYICIYISKLLPSAATTRKQSPIEGDQGIKHGG